MPSIIEKYKNNSSIFSVYKKQHKKGRNQATFPSYRGQKQGYLRPKRLGTSD
jgi:hypothetical protein